MALVKTVTMGVYNLPLEYHRVHAIYKVVNEGTRIITRSYLNSNEREREKSGESVFVHESDEPAEEWEGPMTAAEAYAWLKENRPEFEDAEDC